MERTQTMNPPMNFNRTLMGSTEALRADVLPIKVAPAGASVSFKPDPEVSSEPKPRRRFTAAYKLQILQQADACTEPRQIGALLRREGIYSSNLTTWRRQREKGVLDGLTPKKRGRKEMEKILFLKPLLNFKRKISTSRKNSIMPK